MEANNINGPHVWGKLFEKQGDYEEFIDLAMYAFAGCPDAVADGFPVTTDSGDTKIKYRPSCQNRLKLDICPKVDDRQASCRKCSNRSYVSMEEGLLAKHLAGKMRLGIYPLLSSGECFFVAGDFDNHDGAKNPHKAISKAHDAFEQNGIASYALRSRSGTGYHLYLFFDDAVPAKKARGAYYAVLKHAGLRIDGKGELDCLFPKQDALKTPYSVGNLIALPFQGLSVPDGNMVFLDPTTGFEKPFPIQIETLRQLRYTTESQLDNILQDDREEEYEPAFAQQRDRVPVRTGSIPEGRRNTTLTSLAGAMRKNGMSVEAIEAALLHENSTRCSSPLPEEEVRRIAVGISQYPSARRFKPTDVGNAERFVKDHGENFRYCRSSESWHFWTGKVWTEDGTGEVTRKAIETVKSIGNEAKQALNEREKMRILRHGSNSEGLSRLNAMLELAKSVHPIPVAQQDWGNDRWLLNCQNGTINLRTGKLKPHNRKDLIQIVLPLEYDPPAQCPRWNAFLNEIFSGSEALMNYVKRLVGYTLTGDISEQIMVICHGNGSNGKSTLLEVIRALLGGYARQANFESFIKQRNVSVRQDLARLAGARFVTAIEAEAGCQLAEVTIKQVTGGDPITARYLFGKDFEFYPEFKLFLAANSKPVIKGKDHGIWRRVKMIPFDVTISEEKKDKGLKEKLLQELPGILAWAVEGCLEWRKHGLGEPQEVQEATRNYRGEMDSISKFISERCELESNKSVKKGEIFEIYTLWCNETREEPETMRAFGDSLRRLGIEGRKQKAEWYWIGIGLIPDPCGHRFPSS